MTFSNSDHRQPLRMQVDSNLEGGFLIDIRKGIAGLRNWSFHSKNGILVRHSAAQGSLDFGAQTQFAQVICFLLGGHEALLLEVLVLESIEGLCKLADLCDARLRGRICNGQRGVAGGVRVCSGKAGRHGVGRIPLRGAVRVKLENKALTEAQDWNKITTARRTLGAIIGLWDSSDLRDMTMVTVTGCYGCGVERQCCGTYCCPSVRVGRWEDSREQLMNRALLQGRSKSSQCRNHQSA